MNATLQNLQAWAAQNRIKFGVGVVALVGVIWLLFFTGHSESPKKEKEESFKFVLQAPPPPPPPPPEQVKKMDKPKMQDDSKPMTPEDSPAKDTSAGAVTLGAGDSFGLHGGGHGLGLGAGNGNRFGWFANEVDQSIKSALEDNSKAHSGLSSARVSIWVDSTGRITKVVLTSSSGNREVDQAIESTLMGLLLPEPPPEGLPMPINMGLHR